MKSQYRNLSVRLANIFLELPSEERIKILINISGNLCRTGRELAEKYCEDSRDGLFFLDHTGLSADTKNRVCSHCERVILAVIIMSSD
jgi:RNase P subunit RPR2